MKLKYYLRGLGIGIVVTAAVLAISFQNKNEMTDAQIKERAAELGMVEPYEEGVLAEAVSENTADKTDEDANEVESDAAESEDAADDAEQEAVREEAVQDATVQEEPEKDAATQNESEEAQPQNAGELITITVNSGDGSGTVARKLADAGLVADSGAYDQFLCQNGYDKRICTGAHSIPVGADETTIAQILTSKPN